MVVFALGAIVPGIALWIAFLVQLTYVALLIRLQPFKVKMNNGLDLGLSLGLALVVAVRLPKVDRSLTALSIGSYLQG